MKLKFAVAALAAAVATASSAGAATYANSQTSSIYTFGSPDTTSYGQVFTAPGSTLLDWTFYDSDASSDGAMLVVAAWDGVKAVGPALFSSLSQTVTDTGGSWAHTYGGINLNLASGGSYIAYLTVAGVANPTSGVSVNGSDTSPLGGGFRFLNSGGVDPLTLSSDWNSWSVSNMQYTANFGEAGPAGVPEPAVWAMMIAGFGLVGASMRRRVAVQAA